MNFSRKAIFFQSPHYYKYKIRKNIKKCILSINRYLSYLLFCIVTPSISVFNFDKVFLYRPRRKF